MESNIGLKEDGKIKGRRTRRGRKERERGREREDE